MKLERGMIDGGDFESTVIWVGREISRVAWLRRVEAMPSSKEKELRVVVWSVATERDWERNSTGSV
jgi:hypothetical protein